MKNLIGLLILLFLAVIAYFTFFHEGGSGKPKEALSDFAIEDTAAVDQIFITDRSGGKVLLSRRGHDQWMVNNSFEARPDAIKLILKTLRDIKVQQNVSKTTMPNVLKRMATTGTKVEFYTGGKKPEKTWYIGDMTGSRVGTYMLLEKDGEKSSIPYITHLLMEMGYLGSRFFTDSILWRDRIMIKAPPSKITSIEVIHGVDSLESFKLSRISKASYELLGYDSKDTLVLPAIYVKQYLNQFSGIYYEYLDVNTKPTLLDSIRNSPPRHRITIQLQGGKNIQILSHFMPVREGAELGGKPINYHPERMYAFSSEMDENEFPVVQNLTFDPLVPDFKDIKGSTNVNK